MNEIALENLSKMSLDDFLSIESDKPVPVSDKAPFQYKSLREQSAQKALLYQAKIHDETTEDYKNLELELHRAFMLGLKIIEHSNSYYLKFNESTKGYIKKFVTPIYSAMVLDENVEYSWEVQYTLGGLEPDGKQVKWIEWEKLHHSRLEYIDRLKTPEIKKFMYGDLLEERPQSKTIDDNKIWNKLFELGKKYDGSKMKDTLVTVRECGAFLAKSAKWGYVIDTEKFDNESMNVYEKTIKPYLMSHKEWLMRTLKKLSE